jgi:alcohol dehydrogenase class IV
MKPFAYYQPTDIRFGAGRAAESGEAARRLGRRCLIVTEPVFPALAAALKKVRTSLEAAGLSVAHFDGVVPNPTTDAISAGARVGARQAQTTWGWRSLAGAMATWGWPADAIAHIRDQRIA